MKIKGIQAVSVPGLTNCPAARSLCYAVNPGLQGLNIIALWSCINCNPNHGLRRYIITGVDFFFFNFSDIISCHDALKIYGGPKFSTVYVVKSSNLFHSWALLIFRIPSRSYIRTPGPNFFPEVRSKG